MRTITTAKAYGRMTTRKTLGRFADSTPVRGYERVRIVREDDWRLVMRFLRAWDRANGYTGRSYVEGAMRWEDVEEAWAALNKKEGGR